MPTPDPTPTTPPAGDPPKAKKASEAPKAESATCGHVNKQYYGPEGKLEDLACTLPAKHTGDHSSPYKRKVAEHTFNDKGGIVSTTYSLVDAVAAWGNAAGKKAQAATDNLPQLSAYQKDLMMQLMAKNPDMTAQQAVAQLSTSEQWTTTGALS